MGHSSQGQATADLRRRLFASLGGCCSICGVQKCLQCHSTFPDGGRHHGLNTLQRLQFYLRLLPSGQVKLVCADCHAKLHADEARLRRAGVVTANRDLAGLSGQQPAR